jgi:uncharacterized protein YbjT (DUF2867 family)
MPAKPILVTGATGFVGSRVVRRLLADGYDVRALVRRPEAPAAVALEDAGAELFVADLQRPAGLAEALEGVGAAYFLVHMIGLGEDYPAVERAAARRFARAAEAAGVERVIYLGGLGDESVSKHLAARAATAAVLEEEGPPLTYFRAAMVIGPGSESYELLRGIVKRLPVLPAPKWLETKTQPIGDRDLVAYMCEALELSESAGREVQVGVPEVVTHLELVNEMAAALGHRRPRRLAVSAALARPATVAAGAAAVTPGNRAIAAEISLGLTTPTVVTDPSGASLFKTRPRPLAAVLGEAVDAAAARA